MKKNVILIFIAFLTLFPAINKANGENPNATGRFTVSGYVKDAANGESLIGANISADNNGTGTSTNQYGFYSLSLKPGKYTIVYSYMGYVTLKKTIDLSNNITQNIELNAEEQTLQEVTITAEKPIQNVKQTEMSVSKMNMKTIKKIPALMGEVDLIKAIQLLPGVIPAAEGTSAFCVRGGSADQNLILLDDATVYNASHLMGFFSVFNNDAIKDLKLYKGDIPPMYGGRLASLLDVNMKDGNNKKFSGTGGLGLISSRLTLEGPIIKDKSSFIASGRRTYADLFLPLSSNEDIRHNKLYFYDINLKINHQFNDNNRLYLSAYFGSDVFKASYASMIFGNGTFTMRWNHLFSQKLFSNLSLIYSKYDYELKMEDGSTDFVWKYNMQDYSLKYDFTFYFTPSFSAKYGIQTIFHKLEPGNFDSYGENEIHTSIPTTSSIESGAYLSFENDITNKFSVKYGVRYSLFQNIGTGTVYTLDDSYEITDTTKYPSGKIFNHYQNLEPRLGFKYETGNTSSVKGSYSRTVQYMQMASTSAAGTPLDMWYTASPNVKPQLSDLGSLGYFRNFFNDQLETSLEIYYKEMKNVIDFKDHASTYGNMHLETELRFGDAKSYGIEMMAQLPLNKLNGWLSYTYSHTERKIEAVNNGKEYLAPYDKPNTVNLVVNYDINKRVSIGATFVYSTGAPITLPTGRGEIGNVIYPIYTDRNTYRLPDYNRLDLSLTLKGKDKPGRFWHGEWNFSVYNAYARKNVWYIRFVTDSQNPNVTYAEKIYLFSLIPSVTYNFKF
jgi:hypothetical protein